MPDFAQRLCGLAHARDAAAAAALAVRMPMPMPDAALCCGGYYLAHPAAASAALATADDAARRMLHELTPELFAPPATFMTLDAAIGFAAAHRPGTAVVHGIWLAESRARAMLREEAPARSAGLPAVLRALRRGAAVTLPPCLAMGWDVLGFAGDRCWSWHSEAAAMEALRACGKQAMAHDLLPTAAVARQLVRALEDELLGAPVLWRSWQRTVHALQIGSGDAGGRS